MSRSPPASIPAPRPRGAWSPVRLARLGFLIGRGCTSTEVALDPLIASTPANVRARARGFGLAFRNRGARLPAPIVERYAAAAALRGISRDELLHRILLQAGSDDALIDNILDDRD